MHLRHTTLSVSHSERRLFCARVCMSVWAVIFCHPSCLALSVLLGPWGQSSPFSEENGIWENGRDKEEHRGRVCNELFMSSSVWSVPGVLQYAMCVCVLRCWMSFIIASKISLYILFFKCGMFSVTTKKVLHTRKSQTLTVKEPKKILHTVDHLTGSSTTCSILWSFHFHFKLFFNKKWMSKHKQLYKNFALIKECKTGFFLN